MDQVEILCSDVNRWHCGANRKHAFGHRLTEPLQRLFMQIYAEVSGDGQSLRCSDACGGTLPVIASIEDQPPIRTILAHVRSRPAASTAD